MRGETETRNAWQARPGQAGAGGVWHCGRLAVAFEEGLKPKFQGLRGRKQLMNTKTTRGCGGGEGDDYFVQTGTVQVELTRGDGHYFYAINSSSSRFRNSRIQGHSLF